MTQNNQRIDLQAAMWTVRLHGRVLTAVEQAELDAWIAVNPRHRGALLRARAAWVDLDRLAALAGHTGAPPREQSEGVASHVVRDLATPAATGRVARASFNPFASRRRFLTASASTLLLGGAGTWWIERRSDVYVSDVGEIRRVTLADGSHMVLNTSSEATVRYDKARREIELAAGEGLFQVAKDPARPFIVRTKSVSVRAVGTVFSVRTVDQRVDVTVTEGVVELMDNHRPDGGVIRRVAANEHAAIMETREVDVQNLPRDEAERRLAWLDGMVAFAGEPLSAAVSELNRHNRHRIIVDDPSLASRPVVGLFQANDPDGFAATVAAALGAESIDQADAIHVRQRPIRP